GASAGIKPVGAALGCAAEAGVNPAAIVESLTGTCTHLIPGAPGICEGETAAAGAVLWAGPDGVPAGAASGGVAGASAGETAAALAGLPSGPRIWDEGSIPVVCISPMALPPPLVVGCNAGIGEAFGIPACTAGLVVGATSLDCAGDRPPSAVC